MFCCGAVTAKPNCSPQTGKQPPHTIDKKGDRNIETAVAFDFAIVTNMKKQNAALDEPMRRFVKPLRTRYRELTLACLETRVLFIDHVYAATAAHDTAAFFPQLRGFQ
jgi:hypothetical protein|tara:strand:+ start:995 stop:1318 length:324 start_codon:yes stop_codon:yes gene_type:complete